MFILSKQPQKDLKKVVTFLSLNDKNNDDFLLLSDFFYLIFKSTKYIAFIKIDYACSPRNHLGSKLGHAHFSIKRYIH